MPLLSLHVLGFGHLAHVELTAVATGLATGLAPRVVLLPVPWLGRVGR